MRKKSDAGMMKIGVGDPNTQKIVVVVFREKKVGLWIGFKKKKDIL